MGKLNHEIRIKVGKEDLELLEKKAREFGLPVSKFLVFCGKNSKIIVEVESDG